MLAATHLIMTIVIVSFDGFLGHLIGRFAQFLRVMRGEVAAWRFLRKKYMIFTKATDFARVAYTHSTALPQTQGR